MKNLKKVFLFAGLMAVFVSCKQEKKEAVSDVPVEATPQVTAEELTYSAGDTTQLKGFIANDINKEGKKPGILVIHEWWGHNEYVRKRAEMLAELGYVALAVDMYGDGKQANHPDDAGKFAMSVMSNMDLAKARFDAALKALKNNQAVDTTKIAAIGYCFGGSVALTMANAGEDLDAVAAFHSGVELPIIPSADLKAKVLVCNGAADPFISAESAENFKKQMDSVKADYKYIAHEGALHAFTSKDADSLGKLFNLPLAYQKEADEQSWAALQELLQSVFK